MDLAKYFNVRQELTFFQVSALHVYVGVRKLTAAASSLDCAVERAASISREARRNRIIGGSGFNRTKKAGTCE